MSNRVNIIAEIGANHNGDMSLAKEMVQAASESGADYAKFQSWQNSNIPPGPWDKDEPFFQFKSKREFYEIAEISDENHFELIEYCNSVGIKFLTMCFDRPRVEFLSRLGLHTIKVASPDSTSHTMISELRKNLDTRLVSTGMTYPHELADSASILNEMGKNYALLYCVSMYPTPLENVSLERMNLVSRHVGENGEFGVSDHTMGTTVPKVAVCHGARWIEKHFTTDRDIPGPDNFMSTLPNEISEIRKFCDEYDRIDKTERVRVYDEELTARKVMVGRFGNNR